MTPPPRDGFEAPSSPLPFDPGPETSAADYARFLVECDAKPMRPAKRNGLAHRMRWAGKSEEADLFVQEVAAELRKLKRWSSHEEAEHVACWAVQSRWQPLTQREKSRLQRDQAKKRRETERQWKQQWKQEAEAAFKPAEPVQGASGDAQQLPADPSKPASSDGDCEWVYQNFGNCRATQETAPSNGAWFWLLHLRGSEPNQREFYRNRHAMSKKEKDKSVENGGQKEEEVEKDMGLDEVKRLLKEVE